MVETKIKISQLVKRVRESQKLSGTEFGKLFGVSKGTITLYESGARMPKTAMVIKLLEMDSQIIFYETACPTCSGTGIITATKLD